MSTWQQTPTGFNPDPQDPNKQTYGGQPPAGYPPAGYPPAGYPQAGYPPAGYPPAGYPPGQPPSYPAYPQPGAVPPPYGGFQAPTQPYGQPLPSSGMYGGSDYPGDADGFAFDDQTIRRGFIRKVYSILMVQLTLTSAVIAVFTFHEPTKLYVARHQAVFWSAFAVTIVCLICMACCVSVRRKAPMNFIFLGLFTLAESLMLGCAAATFDKQEVLLAVGVTAVVCFALTLFAFQTKWDFTVCGAGLFVAVVILMIFGLVLTFVGTSKIATLVYGSFGALLFSMYLVYDTQLMMGGKHKYSISPEEYIFASLNLYLDIINIFLYVLTIIGASRD